MLETARNAYILFGIEPTKDLGGGQRGAAGAARRRRRGFHVVRLRRIARSRATCCCRSARSPRPPARSSMPKVVGRASTPRRTSRRRAPGLARATRARQRARVAEVRVPRLRVMSSAALESEIQTERARCCRPKRRTRALSRPSLRRAAPSTARCSTCRSTPSMRSSGVPSRCKRPCSASRGRRERSAAAIQRVLGDCPAGAAARHRQRAEDRRGAGSADLGCRVLHVLGAQDPRLDARAPRAEPRRLEGVLQPFADVIKMLFKEIVLPAKANRFLFLTAPVLVARAGVCGVGRRAAVSDTFVIADIDAGLLYVLALTSLGIYGVILAGWASNSKYAFLGAMRSAAQMVAYEIAMGFALVGVLMAGGSLNLGDIILAQQGTSIRAGSSGRCSRCSSSTSSRVWPKPIARRSTSPRASPRSSRASMSSTRASRSACSSSPSTRT